jgi:hypothetical protein
MVRLVSKNLIGQSLIYNLLVAMLAYADSEYAQELSRPLISNVSITQFPDYCYVPSTRSQDIPNMEFLSVEVEHETLDSSQLPRSVPTFARYLQHCTQTVTRSNTFQTPNRIYTARTHSHQSKSNRCSSQYSTTTWIDNNTLYPFKHLPDTFKMPFEQVEFNTTLYKSPHCALFDPTKVNNTPDYSV